VELALKLDAGGYVIASAQAPATWADLYDRHAQAVARWASRLGGPEADVEDIVQEVFLTVHRSLATFRGDSKITTWLYRITENVVQYRRRKDKRSGTLSGSPEEVAGNLPSKVASPLEDVERRQASDLVYRVLDGMSEKLRSALILFELEGMSGEEIAELTDTRLATVWVRLHRAREEFLRRLRETETGKEQR
jgi:RNA polymerase sigma-70 factor, ECF subfamily